MAAETDMARRSSMGANFGVEFGHVEPHNPFASVKSLPGQNVSVE